MQKSPASKLSGQSSTKLWEQWNILTPSYYKQQHQVHCIQVDLKGKMPLPAWKTEKQMMNQNVDKP